MIHSHTHSLAMVGRRRADFDQHKDLIIKLYHDKTPWSKIEDILLEDHGCRVKSRTIMRRFKEWDLDFHRVQTKKSDDLNHHIRSYWEDRSTRPKTDEELLQRLLADGFTVSLSAIIQIRKEMNLYRRWDERLGRYRPDSELGRRGRRRQKHSAFTEAKLAPPPDASDPEDGGDTAQGAGQHELSPQPWSPGPQGMQGAGDSAAVQHLRPHQQGRPPTTPALLSGQGVQLAPQPAPAHNRTPGLDAAGRDL